MGKRGFKRLKGLELGSRWGSWEASLVFHHHGIYVVCTQSKRGFRLHVTTMNPNMFMHHDRTTNKNWYVVSSFLYVTFAVFRLAVGGQFLTFPRIQVSDTYVYCGLQTQ